MTDKGGVMADPAGPDGRLLAGRYRLGQVLGRGGMGVVWAAQDEMLGRPVAVKEVRPSPDLDPEQRDLLRRRTMREARAAARVVHPSAVTVYDVVESEGELWIVMQLLPSRTLADVLAESGPIAPSQAAGLGIDLVDALSTAHAAGVLHRDVKPANVILTESGRAVLTDFGIATVEDDPTLTSIGMLVGSPGYMAPERARGETPSPASDLWSLGATLYAAVEGDTPFRREGQLPTLNAIVTEAPPDAEHGGALQPVIALLLSRDPAERPTAAHLRELLLEARDATAAERAAPVSVSPDAVSTEARAGGAVAPEAVASEAVASEAATPEAVAPAAAAPAADTEVAAAADAPVADTPSQRIPWRQWTVPDLLPLPTSRTASVPVATPPDADEAEPEADAADAEPDAPEVDEPEPSAPETVTPEPAEPERVAPAPVAAGSGAAGSGAAAASTGSSGRTPVPASFRTGPFAAAPDRAAGRRRPYLLVVPLLVVVLVAAIWVGLRGSGDDDRTTPRAAPAARTSPTAGPSPSASPVPTTPASEKAPASPSASPSTKSSAGSGGSAVPAGFTRKKDPTGFTVAVPKGWKRSVKGSSVYFKDTKNRSYLQVATTTQPKPDALKDWKNQSSSAAGRFPGYKLVRLERVDYRDWDAADWEFTWRAPGGRLHVLNRNIRVNNNRAYALLWSVPSSDWSQRRDDFDTVATSFKSAS